MLRWTSPLRHLPQRLRSASLVAALMAANLTSATAAGSCPIRYPALAKGFNLTGVFDSDTIRVPSDITLRQLRSNGFLHVRLPISADEIIADFAGETKARLRLQDIDYAVSELIKLDYSIIVELHGSKKLFDQMRADPDKASESIIKAWTAMAPGFTAERKGRMFAELMNEPPLEGQNWYDQQVKLLPKLRELLPDTPIILSTGNSQRVEALPNVPKPTDKNVMYAFHFYDPFAFTHQGASWLNQPGLEALRKLPFPMDPTSKAYKDAVADLRKRGFTQAADDLAANTEAYKVADIDNAFANVAKWSTSTDVPVLLGEFGVVKFNATPDDRMRWIAAVAKAAKKYCFGWSHWDYADAFGMVNASTGVIDPKILRALNP